ncbi:uncharacterized protein LOC127659300 isoform X2 [Xyrauchen texanus]|nr:uncharacterized protein LOC127659300 isoform X2 [Xyrauchen texanus]
MVSPVSTEFHDMAVTESEFLNMAAAEPESAPGHVTVAPESAPCHVTTAPESAPCHVTAKPESAPYHVTAMPESAPYHVTAKPQTSPCHVTAEPQSAPCHVTAKPQTAPCHVISKPLLHVPGQPLLHSPGRLLSTVQARLCSTGDLHPYNSTLVLSHIGSTPRVSHPPDSTLIPCSTPCYVKLPPHNIYMHKKTLNLCCYIFLFICLAGKLM